ncbi:hypothetical protein [Pseudomonas brassicacearum]|jgi:hypothetical protein|uniref:hypothetical protein n=1 Tax=Pseudomonas brassicacearum TaxID=930166 RepID=UPI0011CEA148|nr:hypothetical protein [Pseudomonas brassicacearum]
MGTPTGLGAHFFLVLHGLVGLCAGCADSVDRSAQSLLPPVASATHTSTDQRLNARVLQATSPIWLRKNFYKNRKLKRISFRKILNYAQMHFFLDP